MKYQLRVNDLFFKYGNKEVLKNINMNIKPGAFISIIGPNGSGKSTLLKNISTYLRPQKGSILLNSIDINSFPRKEISKNISVVPQNTSLEFDFKVKDIVMMGRHPYIDRFRGETSQDIKIVEKAMYYTNIIMLSHRMFNELSGGEKQRVILAQALAQEPKILLLDEPVSHLDLQHQVEILDLIKNMSTLESLTIISVLHDLNMASEYSDYIILLKDGKVLYEGKPDEVLNQENIAEAFNINVYINGNPMTGKPYIYTISGIPKEKREMKLHIICGGGSGQSLIRDLSSKGYSISTGVLNIGDTDWTIAKENKLEIAEEAPFMEISSSAYKKNLELIAKSDVIILTPVYFSNANIKNLKVLLDADLKDKDIYIIDHNFSKHDYTKGKARKIYERLLGKKNVILISKVDIFDMLIKKGEYNETK